MSCECRQVGSSRQVDHSSRGALPKAVRLNECDREASIKRRPWTTKGFCAMGGGGDDAKEYNKYLQDCIPAVHKMHTITLSRSNPILLHPYIRKHSIGLPVVLLSLFAIWFETVNNL